MFVRSAKGHVCQKQTGFLLSIFNKIAYDNLSKTAKMKKTYCQKTKQVIYLTQVNGNVTDNDTDIVAETVTANVTKTVFT